MSNGKYRQLLLLACFEDIFETKAQRFKNSEIDVREFGDDRFNRKCPKCGFHWNENDVERIFMEIEGH